MIEVGLTTEEITNRDPTAAPIMLVLTNLILFLSLVPGNQRIIKKINLSKLTGNNMLSRFHLMEGIIAQMYM